MYLVYLQISTPINNNINIYVFVFSFALTRKHPPKETFPPLPGPVRRTLKYPSPLSLSFWPTTGRTWPSYIWTRPRMNTAPLPKRCWPLCMRPMCACRQRTLGRPFIIMVTLGTLSTRLSPKRSRILVVCGKDWIYMCKAFGKCVFA